VDAQGNRLKSIVEFAEEAGMHTGVVATSTITHATPAAFVAHNPDRGKYEEIASDFVGSGLELFIGGGRAHFVDREDGRNLLQELESEGYFIGDDLADIGPDADLPIAILTDTLAMPPAMLGRDDLLQEITGKSIELLSESSDGFFLMVEASQIDWAAHDNNTEYLVSEMLDFDETIGVALDFAIQDGNTLVIVTADHETGGFSVESGNLETGEVVGDFTSDGHTGTMVPVFAYGPGAIDFAGIYENTAIFDKMMMLLDLE
jgi:alkaline phosphatase